MSSWPRRRPPKRPGSGPSRPPPTRTPAASGCWSSRPSPTTRTAGCHSSSSFPAAETLTGIATFLDSRRTIGTRVVVEPPAYQGVTVVAMLRARPWADPSRLQRTATDALYAYLHPISGGMEGKGWDFGRPVHMGEVYALLQRLPGYGDGGRRPAFRRQPHHRPAGPGGPAGGGGSECAGLLLSAPGEGGGAVAVTFVASGRRTQETDLAAVNAAMRGLIEGLPTPRPIGAELPSVFQEDDFCQRMMSALDEVLAPLFTTLDCFDSYLDPAAGPAGFRRLAGRMGRHRHRRDLDPGAAAPPDPGRRDPVPGPGYRRRARRPRPPVRGRDAADRRKRGLRLVADRRQPHAGVAPTASDRAPTGG